MKKILFGFMMLALLAGCSNDDMPDVEGVDSMTGKPVQVSAGVDALTTRAGMTTGDLTTLGLTIVNPNSAEYSFRNVKYEKIGSPPSRQRAKRFPCDRTVRRKWK